MKRIDVDDVLAVSGRRHAWHRDDRAVFLDRDGTLDRGGRAISIGSSGSTFFPFSVDAVRVLNRAGFAVVVVTNQAGIARGMFDEAFVARGPPSHRRASATRAARAIDGFYYCPHHPDGDASPQYRGACDCRKPQPGSAAPRGHGSRPRSRRARSWSAIAGTTCRPAQAVGARGVLVRTGLRTRRRKHRRRPASRPAAIVDNLIDAAVVDSAQPLMPIRRSVAPALARRCAAPGSASRSSAI